MAGGEGRGGVREEGKEEGEKGRYKGKERKGGREKVKEEGEKGSSKRKEGGREVKERRGK